MLKQRSTWLSIVFTLVLTGVHHLVLAQGFTAEIFAGTAWSLPMRIKINQPGTTSIQFKGRFSTRPFRGAPYYVVRIGSQRWTAELLHHKIYLENTTSEVEHLEVSHGYNMVSVNNTLPIARSTLRIGIGMVVGHPEGTVRGKPINPARSLLGGGYHISGFCLQVAFGPPLAVSENLFFRPEAKLTAACARMPLADGGSLFIPNLALHTLFGIGYRTD